MALTYTNNISLGYTAPDFSLPDVVSGKNVTFNEVRGEKGTVVAFICNHCPYVIHIREELVQIAQEYHSKGIRFVAVSSNDIIHYPDDAPDKMKELANEMNFPFPYLFDESQDVAKAYDAACTPDFSVFDQNNKCVYRGRMDDSTPGNGNPVTGKDLRDVLDLILAGSPVPTEQHPSCGCNIKWK